MDSGDFYNEELKGMLREKGYRQIHRNFLLTYAYARKHGCEYFVNVVISPEENSGSVREIGEMKSKMTRYTGCIMKIGLREFVGRGERKINTKKMYKLPNRCGPEAELFSSSYTLDKVDALL